MTVSIYLDVVILYLNRPFCPQCFYTVGWAYKIVLVWLCVRWDVKHYSRTHFYSTLVIFYVHAGVDIDCTPTLAGHEYAGYTSVTVSGRQCQEWSSSQPHTPSGVYDYNFPEGSAVKASNYCRNPHPGWSGLWCYTMDKRIRWEKCDVPTCGRCCSVGHRLRIANDKNVELKSFHQWVVRK